MFFSFPAVVLLLFFPSWCPCIHKTRYRGIDEKVLIFFTLVDGIYERQKLDRYGEYRFMNLASDKGYILVCAYIHTLVIIVQIGYN